MGLSTAFRVLPDSCRLNFRRAFEIVHAMICMAKGTAMPRKEKTDLFQFDVRQAEGICTLSSLTNALRWSRPSSPQWVWRQSSFPGRLLRRGVKSVCLRLFRTYLFISYKQFGFPPFGVKILAASGATWLTPWKLDIQLLCGPDQVLYRQRFAQVLGRHRVDGQQSFSSQVKALPQGTVLGQSWRCNLNVFLGGNKAGGDIRDALL